MEKDKIFFAEEGLTSTSADYVANLAKEYIRQQEAELNSVAFLNKIVSLIGNDNSSVLQRGMSDISYIPELLKEVSEAKSLIAWLREAIKAKERLTKECELMADVRYMEANNITYPVSPVKGHVLTEDEYYSNLSVKERNRYYALETEAAVIGKYIHPEGEFAKARRELNYYLHNPNRIEGNGRDALIYSCMPSVSVEDVDEMFFELQAAHRQIQSQLNSMKHQCRRAINESETKAQEEYMNAVHKYNLDSKMLQERILKYRTEELRKIDNYKIVIPDSLKGIYEKVSKLGK